MSQQYRDVETPIDSLVPGQFNPLKVDELLIAALAAIGWTIPPVVHSPCNEADQLISVSLPEPVTQEQVDAVMAVLLAVCNDPTRNDLTADQADDALLQTRFDDVVIAIDAMAGISNGALRKPPVSNTDGYADQFTGTLLVSGTSLKEQLLTNTAWNALTAGAKADLLRTVFLAALPIMAKWVRSCANVARGCRYLLKKYQQEHI